MIIVATAVVITLYLFSILLILVHNNLIRRDHIFDNNLLVTYVITLIVGVSSLVAKEAM